MKKYFRYYFICWLFIFVTFNVVAFVFPFPRDETGTLTNNFWISYFFYTVVLLGLLLSSWMLFKDENKFKLFLGIPLVSISFGVLFVTTVICVFLLAVPQIPIWIGIIASFAVGASSTISPRPCHGFSLTENIVSTHAGIKNISFKINLFFYCGCIIPHVFYFVNTYFELI